MKHLLVLAATLTLASANVVFTGHSVVTVDGNRGSQAVTTVTADRELLENPGFETGVLSPWETDAWIVDTKYPHGGTYCADVVGNHWIWQLVDTTPGSEIQSITFWARQPDQPAAQAYDFFYSDGTFDEYVHFPMPDWQQFDVTSYLNRSKSLVALRIWGYSGGGPGPDSTYVDDVSIQAAGQGPDIQIQAVLSPSETIPFGQPDTPRVFVVNHGTTADSFSIVVMIEDICDPDPYYWDTVAMLLLPGGNAIAEFDTWYPLYPALHRVSSWLVLEGNSNNDTVRQFFWVRPITGLAAQARLPRKAARASVGRAFHFDPGSGPVTVWDAAGRAVWRGTGVWDGYDLRGCKAEPGVYCARSRTRAERLVLVR